ncbi:MAG: hypothetical protein ACRD1L_09180 [Terriglobales bacterium]
MRHRALAFGLLAASCLAAQAPAPAQAAAADASADVPRVTFTRSFKGSDPAFLEIQVSQDGHARFQAKDTDTDPLSTLTFTASPAAVQEIFSRTATLGGFASPLQSKQKVAYTGDKMLAFDDATRHNAQEFTYTTIPPAAALVELFEKISVSGTDAIRVQRAMRYDRLDLLDLMDHVQSDWSAHLMAEPQLLAPVLEQAAANPDLMDAARKRAQKLAQAMTASPHKP